MKKLNNKNIKNFQKQPECRDSLDDIMANRGDIQLQNTTVSYDDKVFITFTLKPSFQQYSDLSPNKQINMMFDNIKAWYLKVIKKDYILHNITYKVHYEFTKNGVIHAHAIFNVKQSFIPYDFLKNTLKSKWRNQTTSIMDVQYIKMNTLTKVQDYVTKSHEQMPRCCDFITNSILNQLQ